ncbi:hypothetical protein NLG97_g10993 [Lecanicillium saksenae]|uniref:Uncharacterized protein n=1 Tax=Lecanicillium saksenae TaxID=468837 RepID=A0ACC1QE22_9HYPO|nr:hypothetical protein NLG97_g10993 [Lecanicillium saksenae]
MAAMVESDRTSCIHDISIPITESMVSFGRGPENTKVYEHKMVTKVPKYAFKLLLWKDGYDPGKFDLPWRSDISPEEQDKFFFWISTKATKGIRINGRHLPSSSFKSPLDPSGPLDARLQRRLDRHLAGRLRRRGQRDEADALEQASPDVARKLNSGCQRFESQRPKNRMRRKDDADIAERRKNVERERQRNVYFEEKRQEAIQYLAAKQPQLASRRHSPATTTTNTTRMGGLLSADSTARFSRR